MQNLYLDLINSIYDKLQSSSFFSDVRLSSNLPAPDESIIIQMPFETLRLNTLDNYSIKRFDVQIKCHSTSAKKSIELSEQVINTLSDEIQLIESTKTASLDPPQREPQQYNINGQDYRDINVDYFNIRFSTTEP